MLYLPTTIHIAVDTLTKAVVPEVHWAKALRVDVLVASTKALAMEVCTGAGLGWIQLHFPKEVEGPELIPIIFIFIFASLGFTLAFTSIILFFDGSTNVDSDHDDYDDFTNGYGAVGVATGFITMLSVVPMCFILCISCHSHISSCFEATRWPISTGTLPLMGRRGARLV